MTAEQAAEAAKGLTFEKVWAALMEMREAQRESQGEAQRQMDESKKRMDETFKRMEESQKKSEKAQRKIIADLSKNLGGLGNTLGRFTESMFSTELWKKFNKFGFTFTKQASRVKFIENDQVLAEVDFFIEDGTYAMLVEIKTE
jgi:hypothetical protein